MENIQAEIATIISGVVGIPGDQITGHTLLQELGVDSLDAFRIIAAIEKRYQMEVPEEQIGCVRTISDIVNLVAVSV